MFGWEPSQEDLVDRFQRPWEELSQDEKFAWGFPETVAWRTVAETLGAARKRLGISKRQAARRAGISEGTWRGLEQGPTYIINSVNITRARPENLYAAAMAVGVDPKIVFDAIGEEVPTGIDFTPFDDRVSKKIAKLDVRDRDIIEGIVDLMLSKSVGDVPETDDDA